MWNSLADGPTDVGMKCVHNTHTNGLDYLNPHQISLGNGPTDVGDNFSTHSKGSDT